MITHRTTAVRRVNLLEFPTVIPSDRMSLWGSVAPVTRKIDQTDRAPNAILSDHWWRMENAEHATHAPGITRIQRHINGVLENPVSVDVSSSAPNCSRLMAENAHARNAQKPIQGFSPWSILGAADASTGKWSAATRMPIFASEDGRRTAIRCSAGIATPVADSPMSARTWSNDGLDQLAGKR